MTRSAGNSGALLLLVFLAQLLQHRDALLASLTSLTGVSRDDRECGPGTADERVPAARANLVASPLAHVEDEVTLGMVRDVDLAVWPDFVALAAQPKEANKVE